MVIMHLVWRPVLSPFHSQDGHTALLFATHCDNIEVVRMLLDEFGSTVDEEDNVSEVNVQCEQLLLTLIVVSVYITALLHLYPCSDNGCVVC